MCKAGLGGFEHVGLIAFELKQIVVFAVNQDFRQISLAIQGIAGQQP